MGSANHEFFPKNMYASSSSICNQISDLKISITHPVLETLDEHAEIQSARLLLLALLLLLGQIGKSDNTKNAAMIHFI